jgi:hypothetical protein
MKPIKIEIKNLFARYMVGGLPIEEAMTLSEEERLIAMLDFIATRSEMFINELNHREANNKTGVMGLEATETLSSVLNIQRNAHNAKHTMAPMDFFELGRSMEAIKTSLVVIEGFTTLKRHTKGPSKGADESAKIRAKEKHELQIKIKALWTKHKKNDQDDTHSINLIATSIKRTPTNVKTHLDELGLRKIKRRKNKRKRA